MNGKKAKQLRKLVEGKAIRPGRIVIVAESKSIRENAGRTALNHPDTARAIYQRSKKDV